MAGCAPGELCITRNTTESIDTVVNGYDWKPGDEAVMADAGLRPHAGAVPAHGAALRHRQQGRERVPPIRRQTTRSCSVYANAITPRTRLLMVSHMINITGHILPVRKIADMAHARGVDVMVDGAHAFAHFDYRIPDLGADYYGASLHKWLGCPLGTGILYVRQGQDPLAVADLRRLADDRRHRHHEAEPHRHASGAHGPRDRATPSPSTTRSASARKEARLRYLQNYWTSKVRGMTNVDAEHAVGSGALVRDRQRRREGRDAGRSREDAARQVQDLDRTRVDNAAAGVHGVRVTPHVFILPRELDVLVKAIGEISVMANG